MIHNLSDVLEPLTSQEFFNSCWGKSFRHIQGWPGKFTKTFTWVDLNEILCKYRLDFPRMRLVHNTKVIPPESFLKYDQSRRDKRAFSPRLQAAALTEHLRQGATLIVDHVEELCESIMDLASNLERTFHERIEVNAYVGWYASSAFDLHNDDHDVIVLQVTGKKCWSVYGMTTPNPISQYIGPKTELPQTPLWEGVLEDGDLLYIPRGWWHKVAQLDEPTIHLTFGIYNSTGIDLLAWLTKHLRANQTFRIDLPRFASKAEQEAHIRQLRDELLVEFNSELLERFFRHSDGMAEPRPKLSLPWSVMPGILPPSDDARVRLTSPRPLNIDAGPNQETILFFANGKRCKFPAETAVILKALDSGNPCSIKELCDLAAETLDREMVRKFLGQLVKSGLIALSERRD